jgi:hypothetical protein
MLVLAMETTNYDILILSYTYNYNIGRLYVSMYLQYRIFHDVPGGSLQAPVLLAVGCWLDSITRF